MDAEGHGVADAGHGAEGVGAGAQVSELAEELQGVPLLLEGVFLGVRAAEELEAGCGDFVLLAAAWGVLEAAVGADAAAGGEGVDQGVVGAVGVDDDLEVGQGGAVVDLDEGDAAGGADGLHPALDVDRAGDVAGAFGGEEVFDAGAMGRHGGPPRWVGVMGRILA